MSDPTARSSRWLGRRYLFRIGNTRIPSYSVMLYLGSVLGIIAGAPIAAAEGINPQHFALAAVVLLIPALIGARLWFVMLNLELFHTEPRRLLSHFDFGAAQDGGLVLSVAASVPILAVAGLPFWAFWDAATFTLLVGTMVTRFGCMMNGCCAGRGTSGPLGVWLPNHRGEWRRRFPSPLFEAAWSAILLLGVIAVRAVSPVSGTLFVSAVVGYALGRPLIALTRETEDFARTMRISLSISTILVVIAAAVIFRRWLV